MQSKKGFTIVELLAVIIVLGAIMAIAIPLTTNIFIRIKNNMYCTKISVIENSAVLWGQDNMDKLETISGSQTYEDVRLATSIIKVQDLITTGFIKKDNLEAGSVIDPRDKSILNEKDVVVFIKNKRVYAKVPSAIDVCNK